MDTINVSTSSSFHHRATTNEKLTCDAIQLPTNNVSGTAAQTAPLTNISSSLAHGGLSCGCLVSCSFGAPGSGSSTGRLSLVQLGGSWWSSSTAFRPTAVRRVVVEVGPQTASPTCFGQGFFGGVLTVLNSRLSTRPVYTYAVFLPGATSDGQAGGVTEAEVLANVTAAWLGSSNERLQLRLVRLPYDVSRIEEGDKELPQEGDTATTSPASSSVAANDTSTSSSAMEASAVPLINNTIPSPRILTGSIAEFLDSAGDVTAPSTIGPQTTPSLLCSLPDFSDSFHATFVPLGTNISEPAYGCGEHATVSELHRACNRHQDCIGYSTYLDTDVEKPLCLHKKLSSSTSGSQDAYSSVYTRMMYNRSSWQEREEDRTSCEAITSTGGTVSVYVEQTAFRTGTVTITIDGFFVKQCGASQPFVMGYTGRNSQCGTFALCYVGTTYTGSVVRAVMSSTGVTQNGCESSASVLFELNSTSMIPGATRPPRPLLSSALSDIATTSFAVHRTFRIEHDDVGPGEARFLVRGIRRSALDVVQSSYDCNLLSRFGGNASEECPKKVLTVSAAGASVAGNTTTSSRECGGLLGFSRGTGVSDQCELTDFCGEPIEHSSPFSGFITVNAAMLEVLRMEETSMCSGVTGTLVVSNRSSGGVSSDPSATSYSGFPLLQDDGNFRPLALSSPNGEVLAASRVETATTSSLLLFVDSNFTSADQDALNPVFLGFGIGRPLARQSAFAINWSTTELAALSDESEQELFTVQKKMSKDSSIACVMDYVGGGRCRIPVPASSNFVIVRVAQSDFSPSHQSKNQVTAAFEDESGATVESFTCGGSDGFNGAPGSEDQCSTFLTCIARFIYSSDDDMETSNLPIRYLSISVAGNVRRRSCDFGLTLTADFEFAPTPEITQSSCGYNCSSDRQCIPRGKVCDQVRDCSDGADETQCLHWRLVETNTALIITAATLSANNNVTGNGNDPSSSASSSSLAVVDVKQYLGLLSVAECKAAAVVDGGTGFTHNDATGVCTVYPALFADDLMADPAQFLKSEANTALYLRIPEGLEGRYRRCTPLLRCSGHGSIQPPSPTDDVGSDGAQRCTCVCNDGYTGVSCSQRRDLSTMRVLVVVFNVSSTSMLSSSAVEAALQEQSTLPSAITTCGMFSGFGSRIGIDCEVSSSSESSETEAAEVRAVLLRRDSWPAINKYLRDVFLHPPLERIGSQTGLASYQPAASCSSLSTTPSSSASDPFAVCGSSESSIRNIRLTARGRSAAFDLHATTATLTAGRHLGSSGGATTSSTCNPVVFEDGDGCVTSSCTIALGTPSVLTNVSVTSEATNVTSSTGDEDGNGFCPLSTAMQVEYLPDPSVPDATTVAQVLYVVKHNSVLFTGVAMFALGGVLLAAAAVKFLWDYRKAEVQHESSIAAECGVANPFSSTATSSRAKIGRTGGLTSTGWSAAGQSSLPCQSFCLPFVV